MSCKYDGMCRTAAICFLDGCQAEKGAAAATTASGERPITNAEEFFAEARRLGCRLPDDVCAFLARVPGRAADGQQGPSRAALDKDTIRAVFMRHGFTVKEGQTDLKDYVYAAADELVALARAPLPAQDDARLEVFIDWYLREGKRAEINPDGHMVRTTREQIMSWLDRAQSDTTGDHNA